MTASNDGIGASATELAARIRRGELESRAVVDAHVARLEAINPDLNAVVVPRFDAARAEADAADEALARARAADDLDRIGPLHGVPITVKEFLGLEGLPNTGGLLRQRERVASRDATVVSRLRAAGAVVLGLTNAPEGGMSAETHNLIYGRTHNPWDLERTPGGSSGGEGAVVAAAGSPLGIGSDIAGSVRIPASFCGIYAHKPTGRRVPNTGHVPLPAGDLATMLCIGPMARTVADLRLALQIIEGPDGIDPHTLSWPSDPTMPSDADDLTDVTVFPVETSGRVPISAEGRAAVGIAADALEARGARIDRSLEGRIKNVFAMWSGAMLERSEERYAEVLASPGRPVRLVPELIRYLMGRSHITAPAFPMLLAEALGDVLERTFGHTFLDASRGALAARALRAELEAAIGAHGVILHPTWTTPPPRHNGTLRQILGVVTTGVFSIMEMPVTQVPVSQYRSGLPRGVQVAARRGRDRLTLRVSTALEDALGGWTPPPRFPVPS